MFTVIIGPPCAGKSTWVRQHAKPGDIVIDFDLLAQALTVDDPRRHPHEHPGPVQVVTKAARNAAIDAAARLTTGDAYVIHSSPSAARLAEYARLDARIVTIDPGREVVFARVSRERPHRMLGAAQQWYAQRDARTQSGASQPGPRPPKAGTTSRGLGWQHQQQRARLLGRHRDGDICWWCGQPMYRAEDLAADHSESRASGGRTADRLLHALCNSQRGDGSRDHLRPALHLGASGEGARAQWTTRDWT